MAEGAGGVVLAWPDLVVQDETGGRELFLRKGRSTTGSSRVRGHC